MQTQLPRTVGQTVPAGSEQAWFAAGVDRSHTLPSGVAIEPPEPARFAAPALPLAPAAEPPLAGEPLSSSELPQPAATAPTSTTNAESAKNRSGRVVVIGGCQSSRERAQETGDRGSFRDADHPRLAAEQELDGIILALHARAGAFTQNDLVAGDAKAFTTISIVVRKHELFSRSRRHDQVDQVVIDDLTLAWIGNVVRAGDRPRDLV